VKSPAASIAFFLLVLLSAALPGLARAGEPAWKARHPEWIWFDGFETAKDLKAYEDRRANEMFITGKEAFQGAHSLCQHYKKGQVEAGWIVKSPKVGFPDHIFVQWRHKFEKGFAGFPPKMARIRCRPHSGNWKSRFAVHCWIDKKGRVVADVSAPESSQANSSGWLAVARSDFSFKDPKNIGRWVCFEMEVKLNTPGKADGLYRIWADSKLIAERTGVDLRGKTKNKINEVMLDCYWNGGSPKVQNRYYDNFVISTKKIGEQ
jgi:hypothetical protein